MKIDLILVNYHTEKHIINLIESTGGLFNEIIVVDNSGTFESKQNNVRTIKSENFGYGTGCNIGVSSSQGEIFFISNPDIVMSIDSWSKLVRKFSEKELPLDNTIYGLAMSGSYSEITPSKGLLGYKRTKKETNLEIHPANFLSGSFLISNKKTYEQAGGFDQNIFMYAEDLDLSIRATEKKINLKIIGDIQAKHIGGASYSGITGKIRRLKSSIISHKYVLKKSKGVRNIFLTSIYLALGISSF